MILFKWPNKRANPGSDSLEYLRQSKDIRDILEC